MLVGQGPCRAMCAPRHHTATRLLATRASAPGTAGSFADMPWPQTAFGRLPLRFGKQTLPKALQPRTRSCACAKNGFAVLLPPTIWNLPWQTLRGSAEKTRKTSRRGKPSGPEGGDLMAGRASPSKVFLMSRPKLLRCSAVACQAHMT